MKANKLRTALDGLTEIEIRAFEEHLLTWKGYESPLLLLLRIHRREKKLPKKEDIHAEIFGAEVIFQEKRIRVLSSALFQQAKAFLAMLELQEDPLQQEVFALTQFRKRRMDTAFSKQLNHIQRQLEANPKRDTDFHLTKFELASEANGMYGQQNLRKLDDSLQEKIDHLDAWYLSQKLKESCEMLNRQNVLAISFENPMIEELLDFLQEKEHQFWKVPAIQIYHQIYLCLSQGTDEQYQDLVQMLEKLFGYFQPDEARGMYKHAQNFCIRKINEGVSPYLKELFQLYRRQLENELIYDRGILAHTDYKNMVTVGLRLKEYDWVEAFIYNYKDRVQSGFRENVFNFSLASYFFETGQTQQAIRVLLEVEFTDVYYQISSRQLLLKIFYETEEWESALYQVDSFGGFLRRNKEISAKNRTQHTNFLRWYKHLLRLKERKLLLEESVFKQRWGKLKGRIFQSTHTSNLEWLKEKVLKLE